MSKYIIKLLYNVLNQCYAAYKDVNQTERKPRNTKLIHCALKTLQAYVEWVPLTILKEQNIWEVLCVMLQEVPFRTVSAESVILILDRKEKSDEILLLFPFQHIEWISKSAGVKSGNFEDDHAFENRLCQLLTLCGIKHLTIYKGGTKNNPPHYQFYLELMMRATSHPSLKITTLCLSFWQLLLKTIPNLEWREVICKQLLLELTVKSLKIDYKACKKENANPIQAYIIADFECSSDLHSFFSTFKQKLIGLKSLISTLCPHIALSHVENNLAGITPLLSSPTMDLVQKAEVVYSDVSVIVPSVFTLPLDPARIPQIENIMKILVSTPEEPLNYDHIPSNRVNSVRETLISSKIESLASLGGYYMLNPSQIDIVLGRIMKYITFCNSGETLQNLSKETLRIRRKSSESFLKLCNDVSTILVNFIDKLKEIIMQLIGQGKLRSTEEVPLIKALVFISNKLNSFERQKVFLHEIVSKILAAWNGNQTNYFLSDLNNFLMLLGVEKKSNQSEVDLCRNQFYSILNTLYVVWKFSTIPKENEIRKAGGYYQLVENNEVLMYPLETYLPLILPNTLRLITLLHQLWTPPVRASLSEKHKIIYTIDEITIANVLELENGIADLPQLDNETTQARNFLMNTREWAYELLGLLIQHPKFYSLPEIDSKLLISAFSHVEHVENNHLKSLMNNVIISLSQTVPVNMYGSILPIVFQTCFAINTKLLQNWEEYKEFLEKNGEMSMILEKQTSELTPEEIQEIIKEKFLRDATRSFTSLLFQLFSTPEKVPTPIFQYFNTNHFKSLYSLLESTSLILNLEDTLTFNNMIQFYSSIALFLLPISSDLFEAKSNPKIVTNERKSKIIPKVEEIFRNLVKLLFLSLTREKFVSNHGHTLLLICTIWKHANHYESNFVWKIIKELPNADPDKLKKLESLWNNTQTDKTKKNVLKDFLEHTVGISIGNTLLKKKSNILEMPVSFFIHRLKNKSKNKENEDLPLEYLAQLFDKLSGE
eukprot:TRINITY_DN10411_c0_g1_i1.p1 TRINITY_DN10411_c0_g1~~TRINITY_DN10411_c0_g1_i1.p1  ORF type:complete len:1175 (-),score=322.08 TRINITY_DN10411_c0_g1_i1:23-3019(-)